MQQFAFPSLRDGLFRGLRDLSRSANFRHREEGEHVKVPQVLEAGSGGLKPADPAPAARPKRAQKRCGEQASAFRTGEQELPVLLLTHPIRWVSTPLLVALALLKNTARLQPLRASLQPVE